MPEDLLLVSPLLRDLIEETVVQIGFAMQREFLPDWDSCDFESEKRGISLLLEDEPPFLVGFSQRADLLRQFALQPVE
jgi:hypothetical protein